jgi:Domain of unknown function (DUF4168)
MSWTGLASWWRKHGPGLYQAVAIALICSITWGWSFIAWAASPTPLPAELDTNTAKSSTLSAVDISSEKVSQFMQAYLQVLNLIDQREGALQSVPTRSEAQQLEREIQAEALKLIEASGLTWQEYLQLLSLANIDPEFGERIAAQLQEAD